MTIDEAICARLTAADSHTFALVAKRVYPGYVPDAAQLPAIMYERKPQAGQTHYNIDGAVDHVRAAYRLHCYAGQEQISVAQAVAGAVVADLDQYRGALPGLTLINTWHNSTDNDYDGVNKRQRVTVEMEFWYQTTA
jgi:hypothetical protein